LNFDASESKIGAGGLPASDHPSENYLTAGGLLAAHAVAVAASLSLPDKFHIHLAATRYRAL
jgi:hypothetical protein